ncbi:hypothetical protein LT493_07265 [Streptomyces tricolor]|nr:hypothetical protein [Streptomyces tricolor]
MVQFPGSGPATAGHRRGHRLLAYVREARAGQPALEVRADGPEAGGVQGGRIAGDVEEAGG